MSLRRNEVSDVKCVSVSASVSRQVGGSNTPTGVLSR